MWLITLLSGNDNRHHMNLNQGEENCNSIYVLAAYNSEPEEQELIKRGYALHMPHKRKKGEAVDEQKTKAAPHHKKHSPKRWVVERTNSWHNRFRKLYTRYEKKVENYLGLLHFSCCII